MKWISVKDKLPPMKFDGIDQHFSDYVLVTNGKFIDISYRKTYLSYEDGEGTDNWDWWETNDNYKYVNNRGESTITHWMPLPELPR